MENTKITTVNHRKFEQLQYMEYCSLYVNKSIIVSVGDNIIIQCINIRNMGICQTIIVRKVIDFDAIELVSGDSKVYKVLVKNENFGFSLLGLSKVRYSDNLE